LITPEVRAALPGSPRYKETIRRMGADGWLGIGWPVEYGGQGRTALEQFVFVDEALHAGAPLPGLALTAVAPAIMAFGTDEQKARFLPPILAGELNIAIGYSEPGSGTDLASLQTRAVRDGDEYVINGQKIFTTIADYADYVWLATRTDPDAPKHKGISMFLVDTKVPGFSYTPIDTLVGHRTFATYYDDVRVPVTALVGEENDGWKLITAQLNLERSGIGSSRHLEDALDEVVQWARETVIDGTRQIEREWVRLNLARVRAKVAAQRLLNLRVAWAIQRDQFSAADASAVKVMGTELAVEAYRLLLEVVGTAGYLRDGSPGAVLHGELERLYRIAVLTTFGGGVNEIQREIIAVAGLGLPRSR
jgi:alkylation response protein AidB-like acyl-CoA dehydrogenase